MSVPKKLVAGVASGAILAGSFTSDRPVVTVPKDIFDDGGTASVLVPYSSALGTAEPTSVSGAASVSLEGTAQGNSGTYAWLANHQRAQTKLVGRSAVEQLRAAAQAATEKRSLLG